MFLRKMNKEYELIIKENSEIAELYLFHIFSEIEKIIYNLVMFYSILLKDKKDLFKDVNINSPQSRLLKILHSLPNDILLEDNIADLCSNIIEVYKIRNELIHNKIIKEKSLMIPLIYKLCDILESIGNRCKDFVINYLSLNNKTEVIIINIIGDVGLVNDVKLLDLLNKTVLKSNDSVIIKSYMGCISKMDDILKAEQIINGLDIKGNKLLDDLRREMIKNVYKLLFYSNKSNINQNNEEVTKVKSDVGNLGNEESQIKIKKLTELLKQYIDKSNLNSIFPPHYLGDDEEKIMEYCLEKDIEEMFNDVFDIFTIKKIAKEMRITNYKELSKKELIERILLKYGFTLKGRIYGINHSIKTTNESISKLKIINIHDEVNIVGIGISSFIELEKVLKIIIYFYSMCLFGDNYKIFIKDNIDKCLNGEKNINELMLGRLIELINNINNYIKQKGNESYLNKMKALFGRESIISNTELGNNIKSIQSNRVLFSHSIDAKEINPQQLYDKAVESTNKIKTFFEHLKNKTIFPKLIFITQFIEDHYGRRFLMAVDEDEAHLKIFTQKNINPKYMYYLHGKNNPIIIDPIIIPKQLL